MKYSSMSLDTPYLSRFVYSADKVDKFYVWLFMTTNNVITSSSVQRHSEVQFFIMYINVNLVAELFLVNLSLCCCFAVCLLCLLNVSDIDKIPGADRTGLSHGSSEGQTPQFASEARLESRIGIIIFHFRSSINDQHIFISSQINLVVQLVVLPVPHMERYHRATVSCVV
jgi:hypothetical protein